MNDLLNIGFELSGHWHLDDDLVRLQLLRNGSQQNVLYSIIADGIVMYIGKTTKTLSRRMRGYTHPSATQGTNLRNNRLIKKLLESNAVVDLYALPDNGLMQYGRFHLNLAAGLEDSLIETLKPQWNNSPTAAVEVAMVDLETNPIEFVLTLHTTYFEKGFFNVPLEFSDAVGADGEKIEIRISTTSIPLFGTINRYSNSNNTPRIMGGSALRDCFQSHFRVQDEVKIKIVTPYEIAITGR